MTEAAHEQPIKLTTRQKVERLAAELTDLKPSDVEEGTRELFELYLMAQAFGLDPIAALLPKSDAEADQLVDTLIALLFLVRGDDLPPFDLERHTLDATATDGASA